MTAQEFNLSLNGAIYNLNKKLKDAKATGCRHLPETPADWWEWYVTAWEQQFEKEPAASGEERAGV